LACSFFSDYRLAILSDQLSSRDDRWHMENAFAALLQNLRVKPRAQVVDGMGHRVPFCRLGVRRTGSTELVLVHRDSLALPTSAPPEVDAELQFDSPAYTYDLDNGVYLGNHDRLKLRIGPYTFRAFSRLPYQVQGVDVRVPSAVTLGNSIAVTVSLKVTAGQPCGHRFRLDVLANDGRPLRYLAREVRADCGTAAIALPSAFNDPAGIWTIVVTDLNTGVQGKAQLTLAGLTQPIQEPQPLQFEGIDD
jgi:hypothetical protein